MFLWIKKKKPVHEETQCSSDLAGSYPCPNTQLFSPSCTDLSRAHVGEGKGKCLKTCAHVTIEYVSALTSHIVSFSQAKHVLIITTHKRNEKKKKNPSLAKSHKNLEWKWLHRHYIILLSKKTVA